MTERTMIIKKIAEDFFADGLRSRDCATRDKLKEYGKVFADEVNEKLAEIEMTHLGFKKCEVKN